MGTDESLLFLRKQTMGNVCSFPEARIENEPDNLEDQSTYMTSSKDTANVLMWYGLQHSGGGIE